MGTPPILSLGSFAFDMVPVAFFGGCTGQCGIDREALCVLEGGYDARCTKDVGSEWKTVVATSEDATDLSLWVVILVSRLFQI